jgi:hypothetical protein
MRVLETRGTGVRQLRHPERSLGEDNSGCSGARESGPAGAGAHSECAAYLGTHADAPLAHQRAAQVPGNPPSTKAKFSRLNFSTLYRIITGHAFIGAYTEQFNPQHTPEQVACPCGEPVQTVEHVLLICPLHADSRHRHLTNNGRPRGGLQQLFRTPERVLDVLHFLDETGACAKPRGELEPD